MYPDPHISNLYIHTYTLTSFNIGTEPSIKNVYLSLRAVHVDQQHMNERGDLSLPNLSEGW